MLTMIHLNFDVNIPDLSLDAWDRAFGVYDLIGEQNEAIAAAIEKTMLALEAEDVKAAFAVSFGDGRGLAIMVNDPDPQLVEQLHQPFWHEFRPKVSTYECFSPSEFVGFMRSV